MRVGQKNGLVYQWAKKGTRPRQPKDQRYANAYPLQGNRVKELCGDEVCEEVVIPGGDFAAESEGILSPGSAD